MQYSPGGRRKEPVEVGVERKKTGGYALYTSGYIPVRRQGRGWPLPPPSHFFGFPDEAVAYYQNTGFLADLSLETTRLLEAVFYVGPLREYPKRLYTWSGETPRHVGERGDRAIEALLAGRGRRFNFGVKQKLVRFEELVATRLHALGLIHSFDIVPVASGRKEYEVRVKTTSASPEVLLTDVGFGVSQVLPVVVECFYVPLGSVVLFEQPEIHLHPAVQAELADLFIAAIRAREDGAERGVQFIIESHSEHFLRRLQRRIAEGVLSHEDAALYFIDTGDDGARLRALDVDEYGRIHNWPSSFFGDSVGETEAQMTAMLKRMIADGADAE